MSKEKVYSLAGTTTNHPVDGEARPFILVGVVTESTRTFPKITEKVLENSKTKYVTMNTNEWVTETTYRLAVAFSIVSPVDAKVATAEQGLQIATGKSRKDKSCLVVLETKSKYFTKSFVEEILTRESRKLTLNPQKYVVLKEKVVKAPILEVRV